jgi:hypothetical protein
MSKKERIAALEQRVAELERQIAGLLASRLPVWMPANPLPAPLLPLSPTPMPYRLPEIWCGTGGNPLAPIL